MTPEAALALGMLFGIAIGFMWAYLSMRDRVRDYAYDLAEAEDEIHRLEQAARFSIVWETEADRLLSIPRGRDKYGAWGEDTA